MNITPELISSADSVFLKKEQEATLAAPRRRYGFLASVLFFTMDLFYGKEKTLSKFKVLEVIARVPYQAWEQVAYVAVTHKYGSPDFARRIFAVGVQQKGIRENFFLHRVVPQVMAFAYYHISWILYVLKPKWSYGLNADFEDHAEHEYMIFVRERAAELEGERWESGFKGEYPGTAGAGSGLGSAADLFRRIGLDERVHKLESLERVRMGARFA